MESQDPGVAPHVSTPPVSFEVIRALPKTDLHVHLDGSLRLSTILELAKKERIALPGDPDDTVGAA